MKDTHADDVFKKILGIVMLQIVGLFALAFYVPKLFVLLVRDTWKIVVPAVLLLALTTAAAAQDDPEPSERLERVERGERAPFSGILATEAVFVDWRSRIVLLEERLRIETEAFDSRLAVHTELAESRLNAEQARRTLVSKLYQDRIDALALEVQRARDRAERSWWEAPALWLVIGVVATVAIGAASVAAF